MFWSKNKKNRYTPAIPQFCYIKKGFKGVYITRACFRDEESLKSLYLFRHVQKQTFNDTLISFFLFKWFTKGLHFIMHLCGS